jgi:hypothetical protein
VSTTLGLHPRQEAARRLVVKLVFAIYVLLIFEGALRKWVIPSYHQAVFFVRDPLVFGAIVIAFYHRLIPRSPLLAGLVALSISFAYLAAYHVIELEVKTVTVLYGWRSYFFYALLCLVIRHTFNREDVFRMVRFTLLVAIPMAALSFWQFRSPKGAFINRQLPGTEIFTVAQGVVRTTGTFTFTIGMSLFVGSAVACLAIAYLSPRRMFSPWTMAAVFIGVATCLAVSGSRTAFMHSAIIVLALAAVEMSRPLLRQRLRIYVQALCLIGALVAVVVAGYSQAMELLAERMSTASASGENVSLRILYYLVGGVITQGDTPFFGYGLGVGSGGGSYLETGFSHFTLAEYEIDRVILECGPLLGLAYMGGRWAVAAWMFHGALRCMRVRRDHVPLLLVSFSGVMLMVGQITFQGTANGFCWIFTGLTLAALRTSSTTEPPRFQPTLVPVSRPPTDTVVRPSPA